jgi:hypothetical protein
MLHEDSRVKTRSSNSASDRVIHTSGSGEGGKAVQNHLKVAENHANIVISYEVDMDYFLKTLVALLAISSPLLLVWLVLHYKQRRERMLQDTILKLAAAGQPVPQQLLLNPPRDPLADIRTGLILVAIGVALYFFMREQGGPWSISVIPLFVGIAYLVTWAIGRTGVANDRRTEETKVLPNNL